MPWSPRYCCLAYAIALGVDSFALLAQGMGYGLLISLAGLVPLWAYLHWAPRLKTRRIRLSYETDYERSMRRRAVKIERRHRVESYLPARLRSPDEELAIRRARQMLK